MTVRWAKLQRLFCLGTILRKPDWRFYPNLIGGDQHGCSHSFITIATHRKNYGNELVNVKNRPWKCENESWN